MKKSIIISTDPIADMLSRIRNAMAVGKNEIELPHSIAKERVAGVLVSSGFLAAANPSQKDGRKFLTITINRPTESPRITSISRVSRPGRRIYVKADEIPMVRRGRGIVVVSTSHGVMAGNDAKAQRLGGELICEVY